RRAWALAAPLAGVPGGPRLAERDASSRLAAGCSHEQRPGPDRGVCRRDGRAVRRADPSERDRLVQAGAPPLGGVLRAPRGGLPGFGAADRLTPAGPVLPQYDHFAAAVRESAGPGAIAVGNSLGGCVAIRAAQNGRLGLAGIVPVSPAGLGLAPWLDVIETN